MKPKSKSSILSIGKAVLAAAFVLGLGGFAMPRAQAQTFSVIHNFTGGKDGANPLSGFLMAGGNLFGTASAGGSSGLGVVFWMKTSGQETVLHEFKGGADGANPEGHLISLGGTLYGTTNSGGAHGAGTVYAVTVKGKETVLYSFTGKADGASPIAGLILDKAGNLYGTTTAGGASGNGTVFELVAPITAGGTWTEKVLYSFGTGTDGSDPVAGVTFDGSGNLYGTTAAGGTYSYGTVFELTPSTPTWKETILHQFELQDDGGVPYAGLVLSGKNLYGASTDGGAGGANGGGTIFELTPASEGGWNFNVIYSLSGWGISGPFRNLLMESGKIYGTTHCDGANDAGTVYELTNSAGTWTYKSLYVFTGSTDGLYVFSNLVSDTEGNLYGTTNIGGANGDGVAFKVAP